MVLFCSFLDEFTLGTWFWYGLAILFLGSCLMFFFRPILLVRAPIWLVCHTIYRLRSIGREHVPTTGPALLVCNHVSYLDFFFLLAGQNRHIHFVIFAGWTKIWGVGTLLKWAGVIPIDQASGPRSIVKSLREAGDYLSKGELVCIFAEGRFTRTGFLLPFHRGFEQILKHCPAPIIPVCLEQVWGSIFSYRGGKLLWKWPTELPYPITVAFGQALPPSTLASEVRQAVQKLSADCAIQRGPRIRPVHRQFVRRASKNPFRPCLIDPVLGKAGRLSYGQVLVASTCLARQLRRRLTPETSMIGIYLPPGVPAALANIALALLGKASVNLNYTTSPGLLQSCIRQCQLRQVITSKNFLQRIPFHAEPEVEVLFIEDLLGLITRGQKVRMFLAILLLPSIILERLILRLDKHRPDDLATVIFSSGSTGDPKGVLLTHKNIAANSESIIQCIDPLPRDRVLGILPLFHSFGYTVTLWVPLQIGASVVFHADPGQSREIGQQCRENQCTIFLATPTILRLCLNRCDPADFASLRLLWCGAEKLPAALAKEFQDKFKILPLEGYGCTELSPAAVVNVPDVDLDGFRQVGSKPGSIGQPLPGVAARLVAPETWTPVKAGQEGLLLICGANVMAGYLERPEQTAEVIKEGWYITGDMARMDEDGFITLIDRLSRFSKIGGEMVPHQKIEEELHSILATTDQICVVTSVADESKGERLVVLHLEMDVKQVWQQLSKKGLPNLWVPREEDFFQIPKLPVLATGKLDLATCNRIAAEKG